MKDKYVKMGRICNLKLFIDLEGYFKQFIMRFCSILKNEDLKMCRIFDLYTTHFGLFYLLNVYFSHTDTLKQVAILMLMPPNRLHALIQAHLFKKKPKTLSLKSSCMVSCCPLEYYSNSLTHISHGYTHTHTQTLTYKLQSWICRGFTPVLLQLIKIVVVKLAANSFTQRITGVKGGP